MNKTQRSAALLIALTWLALSLSPAHAATVTVRVGMVQAPAGGTIEVPIEVIGAPGIGALQLELVYDPAVLTAQEVVKGPLLTNAMIEATIAPRGRAGMAMVSPDSIKGDGVIAKVRFKVVGNPDQKSALTLDKVQAWERDTGRDVLIKTEAGLVTLVADFTLWIFVAIVALLLFLLLIAALLIWRKRPSGRQSPYAPQVYGAPPPADYSSAGSPPRPTHLPK